MVWGTSMFPGLTTVAETNIRTERKTNKQGTNDLSWQVSCQAFPTERRLHWLSCDSLLQNTSCLNQCRCLLQDAWNTDSRPVVRHSCQNFKLKCVRILKLCKDTLKYKLPYSASWNGSNIHKKWRTVIVNISVIRGHWLIHLSLNLGYSVLYAFLYLLWYNPLILWRYFKIIIYLKISLKPLNLRLQLDSVLRSSRFLVILSAQLGVQESRPGPEDHRADPQGGEDWRAGGAAESAPAAALQGQQETTRSGLQPKSSLQLRVTSA